MRNKTNFFASLIALVFVLLTLGCSEKSGESPGVTVSSPEVEETAIVFGIYTADKASAVVDDFAPIIDWLEESLSRELDRPVRIQMKIANSYLMGISDIEVGDAHISRLGPASYVHATNENPKLEILAMESSGGERTFKGVIAVHADSDLQTLADLKGKRFAFGSPLSTIGRYLSQSYLMDAGIYAKDLASFEYLDRHDVVGMAVAAGEFDAGALKSGTFDKLVESGSPLRKLYEFDNVTKPWVVHPSLDAEVRAAMRKVMLEITPQDAARIGVDGFLPSGHEYYIETGEAMARAKGFDPGLSE